MSDVTAAAAHPVPVGPAALTCGFAGRRTGSYRLQAFRRPTVLVFYPADWSPACTDQLILHL